MAQALKHQPGRRRQATVRNARPARPPTKVAITLRLDAERVRRLEAAAKSENRSLTNYVETALLRDLARHDEAARVITMYAAPGTSRRIRPEHVVREDDESDQEYAERQALLVELWSIPDNG